MHIFKLLLLLHKDISLFHFTNLEYFVQMYYLEIRLNKDI